MYVRREEWGNPRDHPEFYSYIRAYSPVDNVRPQAYPHILATGALRPPPARRSLPAAWAPLAHAASAGAGT